MCVKLSISYEHIVEVFSLLHYSSNIALVSSYRPAAQVK
jgi:hypothetical protein